MAMDLRAGHYPSDWKKTYYKADEVGDFHIGRQVGIGRVGHPDGTVLPAHFKDPAHPEVIAACKGCFPWWHEAYATAGFKKAAIRALAAVVHRREWIKEKDLCIVDTCPLFQDEARLNSLALKLGDIRGNGLERTGVDNADLVRASASISLSMYRMTSNDIRYEYHTRHMIRYGKLQTHHFDSHLTSHIHIHTLPTCKLREEYFSFYPFDPIYIIELPTGSR